MERSRQCVTFMRAWIVQKSPFKLFMEGITKNYAPIWDVIDKQWHNLLHRPIHAVAHFLNPAYQFNPNFKADEEVLSGLYDVIERMSPDAIVGTVIFREIEMYKKALGDLFSRDLCKEN